MTRTALLAESLPITITLSSPASQTLHLDYVTASPSQPSVITFDPPFLEFPPGTTQLTFVYRTKTGAVSGSLALSLVAPYE